MAKHQVCHIEWYVSDVVRAQEFYEGLFGWTFRSFNDDMVVFGQGDQHIGGLMRSDDIRPGNSPTVWLEVDNVDMMISRALELGGLLAADKHAVPHVGWAAQIGDLDGNLVGMVQFTS